LTVVPKYKSRAGDEPEGAPTPFLTAAEAGDYTSLGERYMRRLVNERRIRFYKLSPRKLRFAKKDLDEFIAKGERPPRAAP
jgi:excisionase family DNA binding protein